MRRTPHAYNLPSDENWSWFHSGPNHIPYSATSEHQIDKDLYLELKVDLPITAFITGYTRRNYLVSQRFDKIKDAYIKLVHKNGIDYIKRTKNGEWIRHRENGPAIVRTNSLHWIQNGKYNRTDGPAFIEASKDFSACPCRWHLHWCLNDKWHRNGGPSKIDSNGQMWYVDHKLHRIGGPAWITWDGEYIYFLEGKRLSYRGYLTSTGWKEIYYGI